MSDKVKLIIEIPKETVNEIKDNAMFAESIASQIKWDVTGAIVNGTLLDDVKAEILDYNIRQRVSGSESFLLGYCAGMDKSAEIIDKHIGKADMRGKSCNTCKNSDDEFSGECYECVKNIQNHYKAESEE